MGVGEEERGLMLTLEEALDEAERHAVKTKRACDLGQVLEIAATDAQHPSVAAMWRNTAEVAAQAGVLPMIEDSAQLQAVGHALVLAACGGYIHCVRRLREIQREQSGVLVSRFTAFAFLKAAENGHQEVIRELLRPAQSSSTAMMGYVVATRWKDRDATAYPFVKQSATIPNKEWNNKLASTRTMLPAAEPVLRGGGWDIQGMPGAAVELHECIRATYSIFLLWRAALIAAAHCHVEVFKVLLRQRALENTMLADSFHDSTAPRFDKKLVSERAKMDTLMYQLVEELSTKKYHDGILYALWGHIQRGGRDSPRPESGRPRCVAQATNGLWEMQLEVPLLMMPVEHALQEEEPFRRYKQLTQLFGQRAKVNIQLTANVEALPNCLQVVVGIKHVRFKVENSRWDPECMGHFPSLVTLAVTPVTTEGTGVTMTNSSSNIIVKIGKFERIQVGTQAGDGATRGISGAMGAAASVGVTSTMKNKPWRFEQLPMKNERGGSFVWTLQSMKGLLFDRSNPMRMADRNSKWRFGRRMPSNPLDELPFTSEGGVIFTNADFEDTMIWRFPKHLEGKKMRWNIEGQIHSTYTTTRYFETRMATFCGDIEESLKPLEVKDKKAAATDETKAPVSDSKPSKILHSTTMPEFSDADYREFLEFKEFKEQMRRQSTGAIDVPDESADKEVSGTVVPQKDHLGNAVAMEIMSRSGQLSSPAQHQRSASLGEIESPRRGRDEDQLQRTSSLWGRRVAAAHANGDDEDDQFDRSSASSSDDSLGNSARRIAGLSVRTRSGSFKNLGR